MKPPIVEHLSDHIFAVLQHHEGMHLAVAEARRIEADYHAAWADGVRWAASIPPADLQDFAASLSEG